ncbi:MAG TPA: 3-oxoacyl-ACP synthase [Cytophagales bacterium]|jgi:3-oxoacyl-[acyl-carrier-protein] synthase III|nr:3-oxoacyl-ACP synthase [Cytophagales bacterium]
MIRSVISATGSYIPENRITNEHFSNTRFFEKDGAESTRSNESTIRKFQEITGIAERRYAREDQVASDLAYLSAVDALNSSGIDGETLDYIIVAHNFGDIAYSKNRASTVPTLASRVKALLKIHNPDCVAYDLPFGCPGWVEGVIHANYFIRSGDAKRCLIIGAETLSRVIDSYDRDSMIYSDGAGAVIVEASYESNRGILSHKTQTFAVDHAMLLNMDKSYAHNKEGDNNLYLKMNGRKVYEFALTYVPLAIKEALTKAGVSIDDISKVIIHQANEKMDTAILDRLFALYGKTQMPEGLMPMTIGWLGNSSVATVATLLDLIRKGKLPGHTINPGDHHVFASVGAGMNINAIVYRY